jgi:class 3 adenylate cyclase
VGLARGRVFVLSRDIRGVAVHIDQRVQAKAQPDEVLVSRTVADLVGGSGIAFADRGNSCAQGRPQPWQLFAVEDPQLGSDPAAELAG